MSDRELYLTADGTPFVVQRTLATWRCVIPVLPGGDGAETAPLSDRTARCHHRTDILVGSGPTCGHHLVTVFGELT